MNKAVILIQCLLSTIKSTFNCIQQLLFCENVPLHETSLFNSLFRLQSTYVYLDWYMIWNRLFQITQLLYLAPTHKGLPRPL